jgi:DNA-binding MarR family transcriptional regulator
MPRRYPIGTIRHCIPAIYTNGMLTHVTHDQDIETLIVAAHALTRVAALETANDAPAAQWRTLTILRGHGALRIGELARLSRVTQPGMTRLVGQMADQGLVEKTTDAADSRATVVEATALGLEALQTWMLQLTAALAPHFDDLEPEEWEALRTTASVLTRKLDRTRGDITATAEATR